MTAGITARLNLQSQTLTKVIKDWRPLSRKRGHRKHSWVRKKDYCFSDLARKSLANHRVNQTVQWFKFELLEAWSPHREEGRTQSIISTWAAPMRSSLTTAFPPAARGTAGVMLTDVYTAPPWTGSGDGASWKQRRSAFRLGALTKPDPHQYRRQSPRHTRDSGDS